MFHVSFSVAIYDLKTDNFKFKKVILGINDPEKEVIIVSRRSRQKVSFKFHSMFRMYLL